MQTEEYVKALKAIGYELSDVVELENDAGLETAVWEDWQPALSTH